MGEVSAARKSPLPPHAVHFSDSHFQLPLGGLPILRVGPHQWSTSSIRSYLLNYFVGHLRLMGVAPEREDLS